MACGVKAFVTEIVISIVDEMKLLVRSNIELMLPMTLLLLELTIKYEEVCC